MNIHIILNLKLTLIKPILHQNTSYTEREKFAMGMRMSNRSFFALYAVLVFYFTLHLVPHRFLGVRASTVSRNETDRLALLDFKSKVIQDPLGALGSWNASIHFCNWYGVTCSRRHQQRVTILDLGSLKLAGSITPHIGNLTFLKVLNLENNSFTHEIPSEIGRLRRLQVLALNNNSIGGEFPPIYPDAQTLLKSIYFRSSWWENFHQILAPC